MTKDVEGIVRAIVAEQLGVKKELITSQANFIDDLGADSIDIIGLVTALEEEFGIAIPEAIAEKILTVDGLMGYLKEKAIS